MSSDFGDRDLHDVMQKFAGVLEWWAKKSDEYPYQVEVPLSLINDEGLPPIFEGMYGRHISAFLRPGWRTYGFADKKDADAFVRKYPNRAQHFTWNTSSVTKSGLIV